MQKVNIKGVPQKLLWLCYWCRNQIFVKYLYKMNSLPVSRYGTCWIDMSLTVPICCYLGLISSRGVFCNILSVSKSTHWCWFQHDHGVSVGHGNFTCPIVIMKKGSKFLNPLRIRSFFIIFFLFLFQQGWKKPTWSICGMGCYTHKETKYCDVILCYMYFMILFLKVLHLFFTFIYSKMYLYFLFNIGCILFFY